MFFKQTDHTLETCTNVFFSQIMTLLKPVIHPHLVGTFPARIKHWAVIPGVTSPFQFNLIFPFYPPRASSVCSLWCYPGAAICQRLHHPSQIHIPPPSWALSSSRTPQSWWLPTPSPVLSLHLVLHGELTAYFYVHPFFNRFTYQWVWLIDWLIDYLDL